jgi:hypothetical protein
VCLHAEVISPIQTFMKLFRHASVAILLFKR